MGEDELMAAEEDADEGWRMLAEVTYDQLLKHPWAYNDQMRVTGTTHTKFPMELNC